MITGVLQDWTTQKGEGTGRAVVSIIQGESGYLDLAEYDDLVLYLDVREFTVSMASNTTITFETAVSSDDASFVPVASPIVIAVTTTPVVTSILAAYAPVPLARYLRWHLNTTGSGPWDVCFRITYAVFAPGA